MSKPVLLSLGAGKVQELAGTNDNDVLTWDAATSEWKAEAGGGGGSGTVTSVGLTGGTSGIVIGGTTSPITTSGTYNLDAPQRFAFDTTSPIAPTSPGQISWNTLEGSLNTLMVGGNVDAIVGQQLYQRVVNADTVTLTKGMVVYVFGSSGTRVNVKRATADADLTSATILGVVAESIAQNAEGFIITNGVLRDLTVLPSTTFADGDVVYLSPTTAGGLTPTKPEAPQHLVMVGYCVKASNGAAGVLLVHTQNGYELGELHDVYVNSPTSGQILIYDATTGQTRWENASLTGTANQVTVTPGAGSLTLSLPSTLKWSSTAASSSYVIQAGDVTNTPSAAGSTLSINGGAANGGGLGGGVVINGGTSSTFTGGTITLRGGTGATNGEISIGETNTANIYIGSASITSRIYGTLTLPTNALAAGQGGTGVRTASANTVFAGPTTGADAAPSFRALVAADFAGLTPYDISGEFVGTPASGATIMRFVAARAFTFGGTAYFVCTSNTGATTAVFTVSVNGVSKGTVSILGNATSGTGTITSTSIAAGDLITVVATTPANVINPYWTLPGTV